MDENKTDQLKVLDLFCGAGGFTRGLLDSGLDIICGIDIWDKAVDTYRVNNSHIGLCKDLKIYTPEMLESEHGIHDIDIIVGGPPCQGFSLAGKRNTNDPRNSLFMEFKKYIDYFKPKMFVMENVSGILSMKTSEGESCIDIITYLLQENYIVKITTHYASDYEVPQNRKRVLIFGVRTDLVQSGYTIPDMIPVLTKENRIPVSTILLPREQIDKKYFLSDRAIAGITRKRARMVSEGKGFSAQILDLTKPSYTIPARYYKDGYDALVEYNNNGVSEKRILRRLTPIELQRIQTFPDSYVFPNQSSKDIIMQIGNAVACRFAYHVGLFLKDTISSLVSTTIHPSKCTNPIQITSPIENSKQNTNPETKYTVKSLKLLCKDQGLRGYSSKNKSELLLMLKIY